MSNWRPVDRMQPQCLLNAARNPKIKSDLLILMIKLGSKYVWNEKTSLKFINCGPLTAFLSLNLITHRAARTWLWVWHALSTYLISLHKEENFVREEWRGPHNHIRRAIWDGLRPLVYRIISQKRAKYCSCDGNPGKTHSIWRQCQFCIFSSNERRSEMPPRTDDDVPL